MDMTKRPMDMFPPAHGVQDEFGPVGNRVDPAPDMRPRPPPPTIVLSEDLSLALHLLSSALKTQANIYIFF